MNAVSWLFEKSSASKSPALVQGKTTTSYPELLAKMHAAASLVQHSQPENVIIFSDNSAFFAAAHLGIIAAGQVSVPLPYSAKDSERLKSICERCESKRAFIEQSILEKMRREAPELLGVFDAVYTEADLKKTNIAIVERKPSDVAAILFTSGSTATPKGVMLTHDNIIANSQDIIEYLQLTPDDRMLVVLPFHYCFGLSFLYTLLRVGGTLVLNNDFIFPDRVMKDSQEKKCTGFAGVPTHYSILIRTGLAKKLDSMRFVAQAGGKLAEPLLKELIALLPTTEVFVMYGQTEATARLSYLPPKLLATKLGSVGKGLAGTKLEVVSEKGIPVKPGEVGEIVASGRNIMLGYYKDPEQSKQTLRGGVLHTGDLATVDEQGYVYIVDRESGFIKSGGVRISTKEVEAVLYENPDITEAAVIAVPDSILGEAAHAFISTRAALDERTVLAWCKQRLSTEKTPKRITVLDSLPKTAAGKPDIPALRRLA